MNDKKEKNKIPKELLYYVDNAIEIIGDSTNDWWTIRTSIITYTRPKLRKLFTTRHPNTKLMILNDLDYQIISYWEKQTKNKLIIDKSKLHPDNWVRRPRGWNFFEINEARRLERQQQQQDSTEENNKDGK